MSMKLKISPQNPTPLEPQLLKNHDHWVLLRQSLWKTPIAKNGALGRIRTCDLCLRRATLYPLSYERVHEEISRERRILHKKKRPASLCRTPYFTCLGKQRFKRPSSGGKTALNM